MIKDYLIKFKEQKPVELVLNYCVVGIIGKNIIWNISKQKKKQERW